MNRKDNVTNERFLEGNALTQEQVSDVYASGTSDGNYKLDNGNINLSEQPNDADQAEEGAAIRSAAVPAPGSATENTME